jgi:predicted PurR-regulated permease PerM
MEPQDSNDAPLESSNNSRGQFEVWSRYTIVILFVIICIAFYPIMKSFFIPIIIAAVFASLLYPLYSFFYKLLWKKASLASFLTCFAVISVVLVPSLLILQSVIQQMKEFYQIALPWFSEIMQSWQDYPIVERFKNSSIGQWLIKEVDWKAFGNNLSRSVASLATIIANKTYTGVFGIVADLVIMLFTLFYFFIDGKRIVTIIRYLLPLKEKYQDMAVSSFSLISRAIIKGTIIIGLLVGFASAITLLIFGVKTWLFWGFIVVIISIIPLLGPSLVMIPAGVIKILTGNIWQGIGILLVTLIVIVNIDNVIRPRIVGGSARMHDLLVFFSTIGGLSVFGVWGFVIGPIIAALFLTILNIYSEEFRPQLSSREKS